VRARSRARKRAIDLLYEADTRTLNRSNGEQPAHLDEIILEVLRERLEYPGHEVALPQYAVTLAEGVSAELGQIDEYLTTYSQGWTLPRMPVVDRAILRLGAWEILFSDEIPDAVAIDEAVAMATKLSTDESPAFINGLLARIMEMKP